MPRHTLLASLQIALLCLLGSAAGADVLDDILERKTIRVGVAEFAPWTLRDAEGRLRGFEVDVGEKLAEDMGVQARFTVYEWEKIIPALQAGAIDVIAGGMAITPQRALQVEFSRPLAESGVGLAANIAKTSDIATLEQLNEEKVVIVSVEGTLAADVARMLFDRATLRFYATPEAAEKTVLEGQAHAYVAAMPEVRFLALRNPARVDLPIEAPLLASTEGLAVRRGEQALLNFLDAWVTARRTDKWIDTTHEYWFGTLGWMQDAGE